MTRAILAAIALVCALANADAATIRSKSGATAQVAGQWAHKFQCLVNKIDASGFHIKFMGGYRPGPCWSGGKHPCGMALDICQLSRDVTCPGFPRAASTKFALACGLFPGSLWKRNPDTGHFEVR